MICLLASSITLFCKLSIFAIALCIKATRFSAFSKGFMGLVIVFLFSIKTLKELLWFIKTQKLCCFLVSSFLNIDLKPQ